MVWFSSSVACASAFALRLLQPVQADLPHLQLAFLDMRAQQHRRLLCLAGEYRAQHGRVILVGSGDAFGLSEIEAPVAATSVEWNCSSSTATARPSFERARAGTSQTRFNAASCSAPAVPSQSLRTAASSTITRTS